MTDLSDLSKFRAGAPDPFPEGERTGSVEPRFQGRILTFDQSLADTGWAVIERTGRISSCGNLRTVEMAGGNEDNLQRAAVLYTQYLNLMITLDPDLVVHEAPPVGGKFSRPESSLCSATALRCAAAARGIPVRMYYPREARKRWVGKAQASKAEVASALKRLDPTLAGRKPMNQAITDAIAVGWLGMEEA